MISAPWPVPVSPKHRRAHSVATPRTSPANRFLLLGSGFRECPLAPPPPPHPANETAQPGHQLHSASFCKAGSLTRFLIEASVTASARHKQDAGFAALGFSGLSSPSTQSPLRTVIQYRATFGGSWADRAMLIRLMYNHEAWHGPSPKLGTGSIYKFEHVPWSMSFTKVCNAGSNRVWTGSCC